MKYFITLLLSLVCAASIAATPPKKKIQSDEAIVIPILQQELATYWPNIPRREFPAGIISQESNFRINAMLRTDRETGCGLVQWTKTYKKDGTIRFDSLTEAKRLDPSLKNWSWDNCTNATYQLRAFVISIKRQHPGCSAIMDGVDNTLKCVATSHNAGFGSVATRIRFCRMYQNCNPRVWDNNLEAQCPQSKVVAKGYGESFCVISSRYPGRVFERMKRYEGKI